VLSKGATVHQAAPPPEPPEPPEPPRPKNPPPKPPKPEEQPEEVAGVTISVVALTAPMLLVEPVAVTHSPTLSELAVDRSVLVYLVDLDTFTVLGPVLVVALPLENVTVTASTFIFVPDFEVTLPDAVAKLAGRLKVVVGRVPVVRPGTVPPGRRNPPPAPAPAPKPRAHWPLVAAKIDMVVASTLPPEPLVPVAAMHVPVVMSLSLTETVAVMTVLELKLTVVCPLVGLWTSSTSLEMLAIVPDAAGRNAAGGPLGLTDVPPEPAAELAGVVVVADALDDEALAAAFPVPPPPPQAAATSDMTARVPTARARRRLLATGTSRLFTGVVPPVFFCSYGVITRCGALR
jgi:hypothetical protein